MKEKFKHIKHQIELSDNILLSTHENPDCDGLGSEIAIYYYAKSLGKNCRIINCSAMSDKYQFIDPDNVIEVYSKDLDEWLKNIDLAIIFDIGSHKRLREIGELIAGCTNKISIDHHLSASEDYFSFELIDINSPATGAIIWSFLDYIEATSLKDIRVSNALYSSIITDTGSFRYNSTTSNCHIMAKELLDLGVKPYDVYASIYEQRSLAQIKLFGKAIESLKIVDEFGCINISLSMLEECGATLDDIDGFTDFIRSIQGVEVAFMISEIKEKNYRINFRSRGKYIINDIAEYFNGGGHKLAAGATVKGLSVEKIKSIILDKLKNKKEDLCQ